MDDLNGKPLDRNSFEMKSKKSKNKNNDSEAIMKAEGHNGQITLYKNKIKISRKGIMSKLTHGFKGEKEIMLKRISSIQLKEPGLITSGYMQIGFSGGKENKDGLFDATKDENTVMIKKKQYDKFQKLKNAIYKQMEKLEQKQSNPDSNNSNGINDLRELAKLKDEGIITEEEFQKKKKQILDI